MLPQHPRRRESPAARSNQYQWREKEHIYPRLPFRDSPAVLTSPQNTTAEQPPSSNPLLVRNLAVHDFPLPAIPTTEEVMNELQKVTILYVNCADPTESKARRQRVLQGEAKGLMAETAASIVAAASKRYNMVLNGSSSRLIEQGLESNHVILLSLPGLPPSGPVAGKKRGRPVKAKKVLASPNPLAGASSIKRNLYQAGASPAGNKSQKSPSTPFRGAGATAPSPRRTPQLDPTNYTPVASQSGNSGFQDDHPQLP